MIDPSTDIQSAAYANDSLDSRKQHTITITLLMKPSQFCWTGGRYSRFSAVVLNIQSSSYQMRRRLSQITMRTIQRSSLFFKWLFYN